MEDINIDEIVSSVMQDLQSANVVLTASNTEELRSDQGIMAQVENVAGRTMTNDDFNQLVAETFRSVDSRAYLDTAQAINAAANTVSSSNVETEVEEEVYEYNVEEATVERTPRIPTNPVTATVHDNTSRFSSAVWYDKMQNQEITLAGVGGIGSYVAFLLSRLNPKRIIVWDPDVVEEANLSGQLYRCSDVGKHKARAVQSICQEFSDYFKQYTNTTRFDNTSMVTKVMICGFDNMEARKVFYNRWKNFVIALPEEERKECLLIDGRLAAEEFQVFAITGEDIYNMGIYETEYLFTDEEADPTLCSYKQTTFMANMIGSVMVNILVNFIANRCPDILIERDVPFKTSYNGETMFFKTIA